MLDFARQFGGNIHSQNGEDLIVDEVLRRIGIISSHVVEIGANDGHWLSNSRHLVEKGWSATLVETDFNLWVRCRDNYADNPKVKAICSHADEWNINAFVKDECDVLSMDTDGLDKSLFAALRAKPKLVIVEVDSGFPPDSDDVNRDGASGYGPMVRLGIEKGYFLLCHTGNLIFVDNQYRDLFPEIVGDGLSNSELYFNDSWLEGQKKEHYHRQVLRSFVND